MSMRLGLALLPQQLQNDATPSPNVGSPSFSRGACTSAASSPASVNSSVLLTSYGADLNRDFEIIALLEDKIGYELDPVEFAEQIRSFQASHGAAPSIRQMALELMAARSGGANPQAASAAEPPRRSEGFALVLQLQEETSPARGHGRLGDNGPSHPGSGYESARSSPYLSGGSRRIAGRSHSPASCAFSSPSPSRFAGEAAHAWSARSSGPKRGLGPALETCAQHEDPLQQLPSPMHGAQAGVGAISTAPRPGVPGLNFRRLKKSSPLSRVCTLPAPLDCDAIQEEPRPQPADASTPTLDTGRESPIEILRMLLPSAFKQHRPGRDAFSPLTARRTPIRHEASMVAAERETMPHAADAAVADAHAADATVPVRVEEGSRVSFEDVDLHVPGTRWCSTPPKATPSRQQPPASGGRATPAQVSDWRPTPGSRDRRLDQDHCNKESAQPTPLRGAKCRLPLTDFDVDVTRTGACQADGPHGSSTAMSSPDDSAPRKDTPSKAVIAAGAAAGAAVRSPVLVRERWDLAAAQDADSAAGLAVLPVKGMVECVPSLRLASMASRPTQQGAGSLHPVAADGEQPPHQPHSDLRGVVPSGARARRLSICLPSAMVAGGQLTVRRLKAGAAKGVASFALSEVFWVESEDELDSYDSELSGFNEEEDVGRGDGEDSREHAEDLVQPHGGETGAHDPNSAVPYPESELRAPGLSSSGSFYCPDSPTRAMAVQGRPDTVPGTKRSKRERRGPGARGEDGGRCGDGLMLPEELWDAWARLSDGPGSRQYRMLESLTHIERITCTSYSSVFKAQHDGQPVVVKIYDVAERDKLANAFAEIGVLLHLAGWPGAVKLLDYGRHEDKVMLMLEHCDESLKAWCDGRRFAVASARDFILEGLRLWCTLAELMTELHERWHVAHCDLKPGNVLLTGGHLKLADFSESMLFNGTPLLAEQSRGTVSYQPPEMCHRHCVDARKADVWAMGCILYEIVTGEVLFKGNNDCMRAVVAPGTSVGQQDGQDSRRGRHRVATGSSYHGSAAPTGRQDHPPPAPGPPERVTAPAAAEPQGTGTAPEAVPQEHARGETAAAAPRAPVVPKLPLGLARPPIVPQQQNALAHRTQPPPHSLRHHHLPQHGLLADLSGGPVTLTGRSVQEDPSSARASDPWVGASAANTAPTTPRSAARETARSVAPCDTARTVASSSTVAGGIPPPPPSACTQRSVAASEYALAAAGPGTGLGPGGAAAPPRLVLVRGTASQCADPAAPDWFTTEEADRMRIMCEEAPSFVSLSLQSAAASATERAPESNRSQGSGWDDGYEVAEGEFYKPRLLSGAEGPSLCDDVLGLLRLILVEHKARPTMRDLARHGAEALRRHSPPSPPAADADAEAPAEPAFAGLAAEAAFSHGGGGLNTCRSGAAEISLGGSLAALAAPEELTCAGAPCAPEAEAPAAAQATPAPPRAVLPPALRLGELRLSVCGDGGRLAFAEPPIDRGSARTEAESWEDGSSPGSDTRPEPGEGGRGDGSDGGASAGPSGRRPGAVSLFDVCQPLQTSRASEAPVAPPGPRPVSLFDVCQPLQTSRGTQPISRSWQRLIAKP